MLGEHSDLATLQMAHVSCRGKSSVASVFLSTQILCAHILRPHPAELVTLDLVPQLRQLGELHFTTMLRYQKELE